MTFEEAKLLKDGDPVEIIRRPPQPWIQVEPWKRAKVVGAPRLKTDHWRGVETSVYIDVVLDTGEEIDSRVVENEKDEFVRNSFLMEGFRKNTLRKIGDV